MWIAVLQQKKGLPSGQYKQRHWAMGELEAPFPE